MSSILPTDEQQPEKRPLQSIIRRRRTLATGISLFSFFAAGVRKRLCTPEYSVAAALLRRIGYGMMVVLNGVSPLYAIVRPAAP